jgi:hypothetical protein
MCRTMVSGVPSWLPGVTDAVWQWLMSLRVPGRPGWIRVSRRGGCLEPGERAGLGISCLALKTCWMLGLTPRLPLHELRGWIAHIQSFQRSRGRFAGFFEDRPVLRVADRNLGWFRRNVAVRRAETRQACATLLSVGGAPCYPVSRLPRTPDEVREYLAALDWSRPWEAGSHAGHLLFFYGLNAGLFPQASPDPSLLETGFGELDRLQDPETGSWHRHRPSAEQIINGAMKVLTGYAYLGEPFRYAERLIDTCLAAANDGHGCNHADAVYVLHRCAQATDYRRGDIEGFFADRLGMVLRFRREDGAFSFFPDGAQTTYYGVPISRATSMEPRYSSGRWS